MYDTAEIYTNAAQELGNLIGGHGHTLVWGGSDMGLMGIIASSVHEHKGVLIGITTEKLAWQARRNNIDELIVTKTLAERKALMNERSDAFVLLPGGIGSLDEITEMLELKKHRLLVKPIIVLNTDGFYDGFYSQLKRMEAEKFTAPIDQMIRFVDIPEEVLRALTQQ